MKHEKTIQMQTIKKIFQLLSSPDVISNSEIISVYDLKKLLDAEFNKLKSLNESFIKEIEYILANERKEMGYPSLLKIPNLRYTLSTEICDNGDEMIKVYMLTDKLADTSSVWQISAMKHNNDVPVINIINSDRDGIKKSFRNSHNIYLKSRFMEFSSYFAVMDSVRELGLKYDNKSSNGTCELLLDNVIRLRLDILDNKTVKLDILNCSNDVLLENFHDLFKSNEKTWKKIPVNVEDLNDVIKNIVLQKYNTKKKMLKRS